MHPAVSQFNHLSDAGYIERDPWQAATAKHRELASQRKILVEHVLQLCAEMSLNKALAALETQLKGPATSSALATADQYLKQPGKSTIRSWVKAFEESGINGLLPKYQGSARGEYGWEARALELYHIPQKPSIAKVARDLREKYGFRDAQDHQVRYFFSTLPTELQDRSPWRMGRKQYKDALREHNTRTTENLPVGFLFQGDGHEVDVYMKHPRTGKNTWRPELTVWMDVKSRYIAGWYLSVAESSISTMASLSHAMGSNNHVPAMLHIDNGSGFVSKMMNDETAGFYAKFGITPIFALPGNAKAKNVERWFRTMEDDFGKDWDTYCGYGMSKDTKRHFSDTKLRRLETEGKIHVPTLEEWMAGFEEFLHRYHNRPHPEFPNTTPAEMWATLERVPVEDHTMLVRPRAKVNVHRSLVTLDGRQYSSDFLYQFEGKKLVAEYDLHDDTTIRLFDEQGRWLSVATLKAKRDYLPASRQVEAEQKRQKAQQRRLENKQRELAAQGGGMSQTTLKETRELNSLQQSVQDMLEAQTPQNDELNVDALAQQLVDDVPEQEMEFSEASLLDTLYDKAEPTS